MGKSIHPELEKNYGEPIKYDPEFRGPNSRRSCTDIICLCLFFVFIVLWIIIGAYAFLNGNSDLILAPKDSNGKRCGYDDGVMDKKYLLFFNLTKCFGPNVIFEGCNTTQVCVEKCPTDTFLDIAQTTGNISEKNIYCKFGVRKIKELPDYKQRIENGECAKWYLKSEPIFKRCIYTEIPSKLIGLNEDYKRTLKDRASVVLSWLSLSVQNTVAHITENKNAQEAITLVTQDLVESWWKILLGLIGAMIICLIYIILMRWIAAPMVWISIVGVIALLSVGVYVSATKYKSLLNQANANPMPDNGFWEQKDVWLGILIVVSILLAICLLLLLFLRKRIIIAIALIEEASKAVSSITSTLFFPIVPWIFQIGIVSWAICIGLYLSTVGTANYRITGDDNCRCENSKVNDTCSVSDFVYNCDKVVRSGCNLSCTMYDIHKPEIVKYFHAYNVIGALWVLFFFSAFGEMVLAATFATWYWTFRKKDVPFFTLSKGLNVTLRYHIGTLAFGSLIITICRLIRIMIEYVDHKLKRYTDNAVARGIMCCCRCFFWCLENFLKFINKNAYIMCAIHGKNFCASARDAFNLLMRNVIRVFVVDKVTDMLLFLAKLLVTGSVALVAYTAFTKADFNLVDTADLHYVLVPVIFISIGAYFIASVFFGVYSMAVDTLFLCFLEDCERNDGSPEKPYFMSKQLMKILGKKNKKLQ